MMFYGILLKIDLKMAWRRMGIIQSYYLNLWRRNDQHRSGGPTSVNGET